MRASKVVALVMVAILIAWSKSTAADMTIASSEGWHTWQIDDAGRESRICCFSSRRSDSSQAGCKLDGRHNGYVNDGDCAAEPGRIQFYAFVEGGKPIRIVALSSNCPVSSNTAIKDHGIVPASDNIGWFRRLIENRGLSPHIREEALFALVQSDSDTAYTYIDGLLSRR